MAKTLQGICGEKDTLLRLGGDEFAMYIPGMLDDVHGQQLADEVIGRMQDIRIPELGGRVIHVSMGASFHRKDDLDFERLYRQAGQCYVSKQKDRRKQYCFLQIEGNRSMAGINSGAAVTKSRAVTYRRR